MIDVAQLERLVCFRPLHVAVFGTQRLKIQIPPRHTLRCQKHAHKRLGLERSVQTPAVAKREHDGTCQFALRDNGVVNLIVCNRMLLKCFGLGSGRICRN